MTEGNRLGTEASAYLKSAVHQPVHWYPWGDEAFAAAREQDKPVLLDIGAVWCHWCHVMDSESYEDPELAHYLNGHFVCIKVDRDERPDVDARYQRAVQALSGQGGWPLTAFLTPAGDPFYGGTYFAPDGRFGRPGFRNVLERVSTAYREQRPKIEETGRELRTHVAAALIEGSSGALSPVLPAQAAERMARLFDWRYGGFGTAPKFPHPSAIEFLLGRWWDTREPWLREIAEKTLTGMGKGGVYDQIGGGFHRYSVDEQWIVPHFEKMSYDNAELLRVYLHGYAAWGTELLRQVAEGIVSWNLDVMCDREHGSFAASQDADVGAGDDGDYFTWTPDETRAVLDEAEWEVARKRWDIHPEGEMHHRPDRNVLWVSRSIDGIAREVGWPESRVREALSRAGAKLKAARDARRSPFVDRTIYVSWNAMMAESFLEAGAILDNGECTLLALKTLERLWAQGFVPGHGMPHRISTTGGPRSAVPGPWLLDDQVQSASAFLTAFEHTGKGRWLDRARELVDMMLAFYWDESRGGFFDSLEGVGGFLRERAKPIQDAPTSSPNATAALVLLRLAALSEEPKFSDRARQLLEAFAGTAPELGIHGSTYFRAVDWLMAGECKIVVAETTTNLPLRLAALRTFRPRRVVQPTSRSPVPGEVPPVALVCAGTACAMPVKTPEALREAMETFGRSG